ncbi:MAG: MCP four helix bundle domain-containing protein, partial [Noviherbaspirillum sp.]
MFLKNLKIGARLGLAFSAVLALTLILMVIGILRLQDIAGATAEMDVSLEKLRLADAWSTGNRTNEAMTQARLRAADASDDAAVAAMMKENSAAITQTKEKLEALIASEEGKRQLATIAARRQEYIDIRNQVFALKNDPAQDPAEIRNLIQSRMTPSLAAYNGSIQELGNLQLRIFNASKAQVDALVDPGRAIMAVFGSLALALGALLAWLLTRSVTR